MHQERLEDARTRLDEAEQRLRTDDKIRIDLPDTEVPAGRDIVEFTDVVLQTGQQLDLRVCGPERIAVTGPNGSGKTTLLQTICGTTAPQSGQVRTLVGDDRGQLRARNPGYSGSRPF